MGCVINISDRERLTACDKSKSDRLLVWLLAVSSRRKLRAGGRARQDINAHREVMEGWRYPRPSFETKYLLHSVVLMCGGNSD
jgi:hypothetical protein